MVPMNKGMYLKNLEMARKALIEKIQTSIGADDAPEEMEQETSESGLMRPRMRPENIERAPVQEEGMGLQLMRGFQAKPKPRPEGTSMKSFAIKLKDSESSGKSDAQIELDDGRKMTGSYQFSDARLKDFMKAEGMKFSTETFKRKPKLQEKVFEWHMKDIDSTIDKLDKSGTMSRDGLRAVAHLGGKTGMKKFFKTKGKYNPADKFGTKLSDYYNKFK
jgi:hypothetical protein